MPEQNKEKQAQKIENLIAGVTNGPEVRKILTERPISKVYPVIDNDLARDNVENDIPAADLEDL